jgi:hypothetical protein
VWTLVPIFKEELVFLIIITGSALASLDELKKEAKNIVAANVIQFILQAPYKFLWFQKTFWAQVVAHMD